MNSFVFHELKQHGTRDFPCDYYYINETHARYNMPFHWHKEWELIHVLEGSFVLHAGDAVYTAHAGDTLLIRDGMLHGGTPEHCIYECLVFDLHGLFRSLDIVKQYLRPIYRQQLLPDIYYPAGKVPAIDALLSVLTRAYASPSSAVAEEAPIELIVFGCISQLFATILQQKCYTSNALSDSDSTRKIDLVKTVLEYIELHYSSPVTLAELAGVANMNPKYFCRFFRSITHQTPVNYLNMYRVEKAALMLHSTRLPITDICMECGFNDSSNFIKVFRKYKGMTPKQYRNG